MNTIILLAIIGVSAVVVIAGIVAFQFYQEQTAISNLEKILSPEPHYNTLSECMTDIKTTAQQCKELFIK